MKKFFRELPKPHEFLISCDSKKDRQLPVFFIIIKTLFSGAFCSVL